VQFVFPFELGDYQNIVARKWPDPFFAIDFAMIMALATLPLLNNSIGHSRPAISQARNANKSKSKPLACVIHEYQWAVLADDASIAGASVAPAPGFQEEITRQLYVSVFMGVPIFQSYQSPDSEVDFTGGVFPREALAIDWRRLIRIRPERNESRRGLELNMSCIYAHGVWRPDLGIVLVTDAAVPTGV